LPRDIAGVNAFLAAGGGLLTARDHQDMGRWLRGLEAVGRAHFFYAAGCCEPDLDRQRPDDVDTTSISWPSYHSTLCPILATRRCGRRRTWSRWAS